MIHRNYKVVFICPIDRLLQEFEGETMTINMFFGISFGDAKPEPFEFSNYDVIVFDETYFSNLNVFGRTSRAK